MLPLVSILMRSYLFLFFIYFNWLIKLSESIYGNLSAGFGGPGSASTGHIYFWDPYQGMLYPNPFSGALHSAAVNALDMINSTHLASGSDDQTAKVWDLTTGICTLTLNALGTDKVKSLKFLSSGYLAGGCDGSFAIYIWNITTGNVDRTLTGHTGKVNTFEVLSNGDFASGSDDNTVIIWNSSFSQVAKLLATKNINRIRVMLNGNLAGVINSATNNLYIWNLTSLTSTILNANADNIKSMEILSNGDIATAGDDFNVKIWAAETYVLKFTLSGHTKTIKSLKQLPNDLLASGSDDNYIKIWNVTSGIKVRDLPSPNNNDINYFALEVLTTNIITTTTSTTTSTTTTSTTTTSSTTTTPTTTTATTTTSTPTSTSTSTTTTSTSTTSSSSISSTTSSVPTSTSIQIINVISPNVSFNFDELTSSQTLNLLNSNYDLSGCIVNCSNSGSCKFDLNNNEFYCLCNSVYLSGYACQTDTRPCSSNPCLNNATCVDFTSSKSYNMTLSSNSSYNCLCDKFYEGSFCESKIDVCQNETCSGNGNCKDVNDQPKCECFAMYLGDKCDTQSSELKTVKAIISSASIVAIISVIVFYSCILCMDLTKFCFGRGKFDSKYRHFKNNRVQHFIYYN